MSELLDDVSKLFDNDVDIAELNRYVDYINSQDIHAHTYDMDFASAGEASYLSHLKRFKMWFKMFSFHINMDKLFIFANDRGLQWFYGIGLIDNNKQVVNDYYIYESNYLKGTKILYNNRLHKFVYYSYALDFYFIKVRYASPPAVSYNKLSVTNIYNLIT